MSTLRLQVILARAGIASRRAAEALVREGSVTVNGAVVRELGTKADPEKDEIAVRGQPLGAPPDKDATLAVDEHHADARPVGQHFFLCHERVQLCRWDRTAALTGTSTKPLPSSLAAQSASCLMVAGVAFTTPPAHTTIALSYYYDQAIF